MVIKTASPGVFIKETDLTRGTADAITQNVGIVAGPFQKGPVDQLTYVTQEVEFRRIFGDPTDENYEYWWSVNNFLEYSGTCYVVRCDDSAGDAVDNGAGVVHPQKMRNSTSAFTMGVGTVPLSDVYMKNEDEYITNYVEQEQILPNAGEFFTRNPGTWADGLAVAVIDKGADYQLTLRSQSPSLGGGVDYHNAGNAAVVSDNLSDAGKAVNSLTDFLDGGSSQSAGTATVTATTFDTGVIPVFSSELETGDSISKYGKVLFNVDASITDPVAYFVDRPIVRVGTSVGVVLEYNNSDVNNTYLKVAFVKDADGGYGDAFDNTAFDDAIVNIGTSLRVGSVKAVYELGDFLYYSKDSNQVVNVIINKETFTRDQGIAWFWPNRPFDGEKVYNGKTALDLQGAPVTDLDGNFITLQGPALTASSTVDTITWNQRRELWEVNYIPQVQDVIFDGVLDELGSVPALYEVGKVTDWYSQQIAFEGIPWKSFGPRPGTSAAVQDRGSFDDEMHMIVYDGFGEVTGRRGSTVEQYILCSKLKSAITVEGSNNYYKDLINRNSAVMFSNEQLETISGSINDNKSDPGTPMGTGITCKLLQPRYGSIDEGTPALVASGETFARPYILLGGDDQLTASLGEVQAAYEKTIIENVDDLDYIIQGPAYDAVLYATDTDTARVAAAVGKSNYLISIAERLKTAMVLISPPRCSSLEPINSGKITSAVIEWADQIASSSYCIIDSGYKYMYDRFSDKYRYVPMNADVAGCMAQTALFSEPFFSPAGMSRGRIKNVVKLGYDPSKDQRDQLYTSRVNPIVTFPGEGTVLYGDKTSLAYSSAFTRINVRRLFIYAEKQIAKIAKTVLFEFNDVPTRVNFKNNVNPFLRDIQSKRGAIDFLVVCDESNNTPEVVDRNEFVADIYIKPNRSINFVQLNFVATKSGISFNEAIGLNRRFEGLQ